MRLVQASGQSDLHSLVAALIYSQQLKRDTELQSVSKCCYQSWQRIFSSPYFLPFHFISLKKIAKYLHLKPLHVNDFPEYTFHHMKSTANSVSPSKGSNHNLTVNQNYHDIWPCQNPNHTSTICYYNNRVISPCCLQAVTLGKWLCVCVSDSLALVDERERWIPLVEPKSFHGFMARRGRESCCNLSHTSTEQKRPESRRLLLLHIREEKIAYGRRGEVTPYVSVCL